MRAQRTRCAILVLSVVVGCAPSSGEPRDNALDSTRNPVVRRVVSTPTARDVSVDWSSARQFRKLTPTSVPPALQLAFDKISLPVLLPNRPSLLVNATPTHGPTWYAVSLKSEDHSVFIAGDRRERFVPGVSDNAESPPDFEVRVTRSRGIVHATWKAFGVAYTLDVECAAPLQDPKCTHDDYARELAGSVAFAGGQP